MPLDRKYPVSLVSLRKEPAKGDRVNGKHQEIHIAIVDLGESIVPWHYGDHLRTTGMQGMLIGGTNACFKGSDFRKYGKTAYSGVPWGRVLSL